MGLGGSGCQAGIGPLRGSRGGTPTMTTTLDGRRFRRNLPLAPASEFTPGATLIMTSGPPHSRLSGSAILVVHPTGSLISRSNRILVSLIGRRTSPILHTIII